MSGSETEQEEIEFKLRSFTSGSGWDGDPNYYAPRLVELDVDAASRLAQRAQDMYDSDRCDFHHLPSNMLTRQDYDHLKDRIMRCEMLRDALVKAGAKQPTPTPDRHG